MGPCDRRPRWRQAPTLICTGDSPTLRGALCGLLLQTEGHSSTCPSKERNTAIRKAQRLRLLSTPRWPTASSWGSICHFRSMGPCDRRLRWRQAPRLISTGDSPTLRGALCGLLLQTEGHSSTCSSKERNTAIRKAQRLRLLNTPRWPTASSRGGASTSEPSGSAINHSHCGKCRSPPSVGVFPPH